MKKDLDCIGIGSVVVDYMQPVDHILGPESKGLLTEGQRLLGGVVLNHLSWASALGLRCGLFGTGAGDEDGAFIRQGLDAYGIDHSAYSKTGSSTAVSRVYVDPRGARAIYMSPGANAEALAADMARYLPLMQRSHLLSTEISQLPLEVVVAALKLGEEAGCRSFLDLDLPPSQAVKAGLGKAAQLNAAIRLAKVLKAGQDAAQELVPRQSPLKMAAALHRKLKKKVGDWVVITGGAAGSAIYDGKEGWAAPAKKGLKVVDTTGAGDAYFGGLLAAARYGLSLRDSAALATAAASLNVTRMGAPAPVEAALPQILERYSGQPFEVAKPLTSSSLAFSRTAVEELAALAEKFEAGAFDRAVGLVAAMEASGGRLHVTGVGKPEHVARYVASSFSSVGTPCFFLHCTEAVHGSAGQFGPHDVVIAISNSGETVELKATLMLLKERGARIIGVSGNAASWLARASDVFLFAGVGREGDALNMAPRASVLAEILALSALGVALQEAKKFTRQDFKRFHPGGALGQAVSAA